MSQDATRSIEEARAAADQRFAELVAESGLPDPRDRYRAWLRELRGADENAFRAAVEYFDSQLVPAVLHPDGDPWSAWTAYGMRLAARLHAGDAVAIDETGKSRPAAANTPLEHLILHLPTSTREAALPIRLPARLSPAQEATVQLLVKAG